MAGGLMDGLGGANDLDSMTPEQLEALRRRSMPTTTEVMSPLGLIGGAGIGAGVARLGQHMAGAVGHAPWYLSALGMLGGGAAGANMAANMPRLRAQQNTIRDAEGQPGGYYGNRR